MVWFGLLAEFEPASAISATVRDYTARAAQALESCPSPWRRRNRQINAALF